MDSPVTILSSYLRLGLQSGPFNSDFATKILHAFLVISDQPVSRPLPIHRTTQTYE
jgi:hypothetical protein